jgi:hypothetical protein
MSLDSDTLTMSATALHKRGLDAAINRIAQVATGLCKVFQAWMIVTHMVWIPSKRVVCPSMAYYSPLLAAPAPTNDDNIMAVVVGMMQAQQQAAQQAASQQNMMMMMFMQQMGVYGLSVLHVFTGSLVYDFIHTCWIAYPYNILGGFRVPAPAAVPMNIPDFFPVSTPISRQNGITSTCFSATALWPRGSVEV